MKIETIQAKQYVIKKRQKSLTYKNDKIKDKSERFAYNRFAISTIIWQGGLITRSS